MDRWQLLNWLCKASFVVPVAKMQRSCPALVARFDQKIFCETSLIETPNINLEYHQYTLGACDRQFWNRTPNLCYDDLVLFSRLAIVLARNLECVCESYC